MDIKLSAVILAVLLAGCATQSYNSDGTPQRVSYTDTTPSKAAPQPLKINPTLAKWLLIIGSVAVNSANETITTQTYFPNAETNVVHSVNELSGRGQERRNEYANLLKAGE